MVSNAIMACLSDENSVYVNRYALDFLISHFPIHSDVNHIDMKITLVESVL